mmetsp:Transcript_17005/g.48847  ORF Transcript_17005/g.48847 Transcript_17005/m.48847 type:complete len:141 (-) Transcript_17005:708-1130(-)
MSIGDLSSRRKGVADDCHENRMDNVTSALNSGKPRTDLDAFIAKLSEGTPLAEGEVKMVCQKAQELLMNESNVQPVPAPITVVGDVHGQWHDLIETSWSVAHRLIPTTSSSETTSIGDTTRSRLSSSSLVSRSGIPPACS